MSETHGILNFQKECIKRKLQVPTPPLPASLHQTVLTQISDSFVGATGQAYKESIGNLVLPKEVIRKQPPARNLSAMVGRVLQGTNIANQRTSFLSGLKTTYPAVYTTIKELSYDGSVDIDG
jgi:hypothetical protein